MKLFAQPPLARVVALLEAEGLPFADISEDDCELFLGCGDSDAPDGVIGVEVFGCDALLRSLVVGDAARGQGCAQALVAELESMAAANGVQHMYLLTNTAEQFFAKLDYQVIDRGEVSEAIRATTEFSSLCPASATVMRKQLSAAST